MKYSRNSNGSYTQYDDNGNVLEDEVVAAYDADNNSLINSNSLSNSGRSSGSRSSGSTYSSALASANRAAKLAAEKSVATLNAQKATTNNTYDDIAKQVYANYMVNQNKLPSQMTNLASGTADSLKLKGTLNYENNLSSSEKARAAQLAAIDTDISNVGTTADETIAANAEKYALLNKQAEEAAKQTAAQTEAAQEQTVYARAIQRAQALAAVGDFSGYAALGWSADQIAAANARVNRR